MGAVDTIGDMEAAVEADMEATAAATEVMAAATEEAKAKAGIIETQN